MVTDCTLVSGAHAQALRRKMASDALSGKLKSAYDRIQELEALVAAVQVVRKGASLVMILMKS